MASGSRRRPPPTARTPSPARGARSRSGWPSTSRTRRASSTRSRACRGSRSTARRAARRRWSSSKRSRRRRTRSRTTTCPTTRTTTTGTHDWYTLPRALDRVDGPTAALLRTAAFALDAARAAGLVDGAHGGVFGQELVAAAAGAPPPGSPEAAAAAVAALADILGPEEAALLREVLAHRSGLGAGGDGEPRARVVSADDAADSEDAAVEEPEKAPEHLGKRADDAEADARRVVA